MLAYAFKALETGEHRRLAAEDFEHVHDMLAAILLTRDTLVGSGF